MITSLGNSKRSKFIDMQQIQGNMVIIRHVRSEEQDADIFTKPLGRVKYADNTRRIGVQTIG